MPYGGADLAAVGRRSRWDPEVYAEQLVRAVDEVELHDSTLPSAALPCSPASRLESSHGVAACCRRRPHGRRIGDRRSGRRIHRSRCYCGHHVAIIYAAISGARAWIRSGGEAAFQIFKRGIGRGMLVGLDLLIAADIIKTVTVEPTLENTATLGLLVLIRTFLSWSIVVEVTGRWPWEELPEKASG